MYYDRMLLRVAVGAALKNIRYRYDYKAKYIGIPYDGWLEGGTDRFVMYADFMIGKWRVVFIACVTKKKHIFNLSSQISLTSTSTCKISVWIKSGMYHYLQLTDNDNR